MDRLYPPGGFRTGLANATALGLLSEGEAAALERLMKVRNQFAHRALQKLTFDSPEVAPRVRNLTLPFPLAETGITFDNLRERFISIAALTYAAMAMRVDGDIKRLRKPGVLAGALHSPKPT